MPRLTIKQRKADVVNSYTVKLTILMAHQSEKEAASYLNTMMADWGNEGSIIVGYEIESLVESKARYFGVGLYPEEYDECMEMSRHEEKSK
jgi:hypothetical protein